MTLRYTITPDDAFAFYQYCFTDVPHAKKVRFNQRFGVPLAIVGTAVILVQYSGASEAFGFLVFLLSAVVLYIILFPILHKWKLLRCLKKQRVLNEQAEHVLTLSEQGVSVQSHVGHTELFWRSITNVVATAHYIFFFYQPTEAIVLPKRAFNDSVQQQAFLDYVNEQRRVSMAQPPS